MLSGSHYCRRVRKPHFAHELMRLRNSTLRSLSSLSSLRETRFDELDAHTHTACGLRPGAWGMAMKLLDAQEIGAELLAIFDGSGKGEVAGSVRRGKRQPRDIELLLPLPGDGEGDGIFAAIEECCRCVDGLFGNEEERFEERFVCEAVKGLRVRFKYCQLAFAEWLLDDGQVTRNFKVDVFRYVPGPLGNRGWLLLMRTGPAEFSRRCAAKWQREGGTSREAFLIDAHGERIATPTEMDAFRELGIDWLPAWERV